MALINLTGRQWKLQGWRPFYWQLRKSTETGGNFRPEYGPYPAAVPGSSHTSLRAAGMIPDWNSGLSSLQCEWVEHRHWEFYTEIAEGEFPADQPLTLLAEGLDYSGWILVDCQIAGTFQGTLLRHQFDLSKTLGDGKAHRLSVVFDTPPEDQGQIGRTSLSKHFKPRYSFSWDWCVRFVPVGIWDRISLEIGTPLIRVQSVTSSLHANLQQGTVTLRLQNAANDPARVHFTLSLPSGDSATRWTKVIPHGSTTLSLEVSNPKLWWPNGMGDAVLYDLTVTTEGNELEPFQETIGFKHIRWRPCEGSPHNARALLCEINGCSLFLQGVNWTPIQMDYAATPDSSYERLIQLYRDMGCNLLRVWGGAYLEKEIFYRLCDRAGILVWQEFPLSSSGVDSEAPRDRGSVAKLVRIARDYVRRRRHHASLLLWCGGNELQSVPTGSEPSVPLDETHPALAILKRVVDLGHPGVLFMPSSPSGPVFYAQRDLMGKGVHHHVHGPWDRGDMPVKQWLDYWQNDDSLLRSETGVAGAASVSVIKRYAGEQSIWPPSFENPYWRHSSAWWLQWDLFSSQIAPDDLARFVALSQQKQAEYLAAAAASCKERFPACAGFLVWMGHDAFPCPSNTSIIDFDHHTKAAYEALRGIFHHQKRVQSRPILAEATPPAIVH